MDLMTPLELNEYLLCLRANNVMSAHIKVDGLELNAMFAAEMPAPVKGDPTPGGWKTTPSDPHDPDPLGLGALDAPLAFDDDEVQP